MSDGLLVQQPNGLKVRTKVRRTCFGLTTAMSVRAFGYWFGWWRRERRQTGQREQKLVRGIEEVQVSVDGTVRGSEEDGGAPRVVDGDISLEAGAAACLFDDVRRRINW